MAKKNIDIRPFTRQFYRGGGLWLALAGLHTVLNVAANLFVAWLIQQLLDLISGYDTGFTLWELTALTGAFLGVFLGAGLLSYWAKPRFISGGMARYREFVFRELTKKNISAFSAENSSLYISALSNDASTIEKDYLGNIFPLIENILTFVSALVMMLWYSPLLTLIAIGLSLLPVIASIAAGNRVAEAGKEVSARSEAYMSTLKDSLTGFSVVKSFRAEGQICRIFAENVKKLAAASCRKQKISIIVEMLAGVASAAAQIGVFLIGAWLALSGKGITAGTIMVFVQMMNYVLGPIAAVPTCVAGIQTGRELIRKVARALPENVRRDESGQTAGLRRAISVEELGFSYEPEKPVLSRLSCTFEAGKSYAIVGGSGSGKSTLMNLLMASHHGYEGAIRYDGTELRDIRSESLFDLISVVQQNVFIFNASIRDNITMFTQFPAEEVERAIALSGLSGLIAERGDDYLCGENGCGLSGGEKQRISIARSLLKKSRLLLVDEATAALDPQTSHQVSDAILNLRDMTRIVITHDLEENLLRRYDRILTLKNGAVAESGSFEELMEQKGYFYSLFTVSQ